MVQVIEVVSAQVPSLPDQKKTSGIFCGVGSSVILFCHCTFIVRAHKFCILGKILRPSQSGGHSSTRLTERTPGGSWAN